MITTAALLAGVLLGVFWRGGDAHAQVTRFRTERQGENRRHAAFRHRSQRFGHPNWKLATIAAN